MQSACAVSYCRVACLAVSCFFYTLPHKRHDFRKKVMEHKMCGLLFCTTFVWHISHSKKNKQDMIINVHRSSCKVLVILVGFEWNFNFLDRFSKKYLNIKSRANPSIGGSNCSMRTDMTKLIVAFRNFANAPRNENCCFQRYEAVLFDRTVPTSHRVLCSLTDPRQVTLLCMWAWKWPDVWVQHRDARVCLHVKC